MPFNVRGTFIGGNTTSGTNPTVVAVPAVNDLFLVFCVANGNTNAAPTCADGNTGGTYTLIGTALKNTSADIISCFIRDALVPNTTSTTVTVTIGAHTATEVCVYAISGAQSGVTAVVQSAFQANQASGTAPAPTFAAAAGVQNLIISFVGNGTNPAGPAVTAGTYPVWTRNQNVGQTACGLAVETTPNGFTGTTVTWGSASASAFASGLIEIGFVPTTAGLNVTKLIGYSVLTTSNTTPPIWGSWSFPAGIANYLYVVTWDMPSSARTVTYSVLSGSLPTGLSLSAGTGNAAQLSGTPTVPGTFTFTLRAVNTFGTVDQAFSITIGTLGGISRGRQLLG